MITILVVGASGLESSDFAAGHPSIEVMTAAGVEDALEKLARNRRIDAILLLPETAAVEFARALEEEDPGAPPLFAPASAGMVRGARALPATEPRELLDLLVRSLSAQG